MVSSKTCTRNSSNFIHKKVYPQSKVATISFMDSASPLFINSNRSKYSD